jgi:hypothetical protein
MAVSEHPGPGGDEMTCRGVTSEPVPRTRRGRDNWLLRGGLPEVRADHFLAEAAGWVRWQAGVRVLAGEPGLGGRDARVQIT